MNRTPTRLRLLRAVADDLVSATRGGDQVPQYTLAGAQVPRLNSTMSSFVGAKLVRFAEHNTLGMGVGAIRLTADGRATLEKWSSS